MQTGSVIHAGRISELIESDLPQDPVWIGPSVLPKSSKMIFGGQAATGKSMVMLSMARALALGEEKPLGCDLFQIPRPTRVLLIEHELKPYGLQTRVKKLFQDIEPSVLEDNFWYVSGEPSLQFSSSEGREEIGRIVETVKPEVLILDPIGKMHYGDENDNAAIARLMYYLDVLIKQGKEWGMSIIFSHHFGKPSDNPQASGNRDKLDPYNFRGASKWKDDPDVRVTMERRERLLTPHQSWRIRTRWLTRQGEELPDIWFTVNKDDDMRVLFEKIEAEKGGVRPLVPSEPKEQHGFASVPSR